MTNVSGLIRPAETDEELEQVFRLRAEVFFGENILHFGRSARLSDDLDAHPASVNLVVATTGNPADRWSTAQRTNGDESADADIVGAVRVTFPASDVETTRSVYFDFSRFVKGAEGHTASGSMLCVRPDYRRSRLGTTLTRSIMEISRRRSMRYLCVAARPVSVPFLQRLGWEAVAPEFDHPVELVPVVPMMVDLTVEVAIDDPRRPLGELFTLT